eukprot:COSAG06_NODE_3699_length_4996_cov_4.274658_6_plen_191_part_01
MLSTPQRAPSYNRRSDNRRSDNRRSDNRVDRSGDRRVDRSQRTPGAPTTTEARVTVRPTPDTPSLEPRPKVEPQPDGTDAQVVGVRTAADREAAARAAAVVIDDAIGDDGSADLTKTRPANSPQSVPTFPSRIEVVLRQEAPKPGILGDGTRTSPFDLTSDPLTFARLNQLQANTAKKSIRSEDSVRKDNV